MRIVNFVDGASSETTPTIGNIVASSLVKYANDAAYEATEIGAPATGNVYYNTTDNTIRYYTGTIWQELIDESTTQVLDNKSIDADNNMITNIDNNEIKPLAGIEATKIADGSVTDAEFQYIGTLTSDAQTQLTGKQDTSEKDQINGYAGLDGTGKISASVVPAGFLQYQGTYNATTNTPTLADGVGEQGDVYRTTTAGTQDLGSGDITFAVGDWVTYNGTIWERSDYVGVDVVQENISLIGKGSATWDADGAGTVDNTLQDQLIKDSTMSNVNSSFFAAGTFQATTTSSNYKKLTTHLISPNGTGTPNIEIWGVDGGGAPDSTNVIVVFPSYDPTVLVAGADVVHTAATTFSLTSGTSYAIVNNLTNLTTGTIQFKADSVGADIGDDYYAAAPGTLGSWTLAATKDIYFILAEVVDLGGRLTLSDNSFISVPALPDTYHQIDAQNIDMVDGECGYITLDRGAGAPTSRTVTVDDIVNVVSDNNKLIITRNVVDECYLGLHDPQRLSDGDVVNIQKSAAGGDLWSDLVNSDIIPDGPGRHLGTTGVGFADIHIRTVAGSNVDAVQIKDSAGATKLNITSESTNTPSTKTANIHIEQARLGEVLGISTLSSTSATKSGDILYETGNNTSTGDTGDHIQRTGVPSSGVRGKIRKQDGSEGVVGDIWRSNDVTGGGEWSAPTGLVSKQIFTASGTWNKPAGITKVVVEVIGAGGAGGSGDNTVAGAMSTATGGGGGGFCKKYIDSGLGSSETITIGAGGTGVAQGNGGTGGTSSFGSHCQSTGGTGGIGTADSTGSRIAQGVVGGVGSSGDINAYGGTTDAAFSNGNIGMASAGGNSIYGGGGRGEGLVTSSVAVGGDIGRGIGGGGAGAAAGQSTTAIAGGDGTDGMIIVWEYS